MYSGDQRGLGMPEAMVAVLLFSMIALALINYLQALKQAQSGLNQYRQALILSHQALELYRLGERDSLLALPAGWRLNRIEQPRGPSCRRVAAEVLAPSGRSVTLSEWFCRAGAGEAPAGSR